jgi:hypothetical protein
VKPVTQQFGNIVQAASSYEATPGYIAGPKPMRGVNFITLYKAGDRWYIQSLIWQPETEQFPLPAVWLP